MINVEVKVETGYVIHEVAASSLSFCIFTKILLQYEYILRIYFVKRQFFKLECYIYVTTTQFRKYVI